MGKTKLPDTFLSYSRRQLYFAESVTLHLQKEGVDVWFDLQQLQAGTVWSDGIKSGVEEAKTLILIVSQASLASPYVAEEWKGVLDKGNQLVLVVFEPVVLPKELQGVPTFDFRMGFKRKMRELVSFLQGEAEPLYDKIPAPNRLGFNFRIPGAILMILTAQFSLIILLLLVFTCFAVFDPEFLKGTFDDFIFYLIIALIFLAIGLWYGIPFLQHKLKFKKLKQSVLLPIVLLLYPALLIFSALLQSNEEAKVEVLITCYIILSFTVLTLSVYFVILRRSGSLLRWMQPDDDLQKLRRRVHRRLMPDQILGDGLEERTDSAIRYAIHNDPADRPLAGWVGKIITGEGLKESKSTEEPDYHIAILSNRSSKAWLNQVLDSYAGKLIFVVTSSIEFTDCLSEVARYQWIDARDMDKQDIVSLARSLGNKTAWKREAALESTPDKVDRWKLPYGVRLLRILHGIAGIFFCLRLSICIS